MYDATKDKVLAVSVIGNIEVKQCQYNGGEVKVQLTRFEQKDDTRIYGKLGRMSLDEARNVAVLLNDVLVAVPASS